MESPTQSAALHEQIVHWKTQVDHVREDVKQLRHRLEEVAAGDMHPEMLVQVECFQNRFIRQLEVADEMFHDLKQVDKQVARHEGQSPEAAASRSTAEGNLRERMQTFNSLFHALRSNFNGFLEKARPVAF